MIQYNEIISYSFFKKVLLIKEYTYGSTKEYSKLSKSNCS